MKCGTIFAVIPKKVSSELGEKGEPPAPPKCPKCGSYEVRMADMPEGMGKIQLKEKVEIVEE